jgi:ketopantoate hydroxymethyltransferase
MPLVHKRLHIHLDTTGRLIQEALSQYVAEVREGVFPGEEHSF